MEKTNKQTKKLFSCALKICSYLQNWNNSIFKCLQSCNSNQEQRWFGLVWFPSAYRTCDGPENNKNWRDPVTPGKFSYLQSLRFSETTPTRICRLLLQAKNTAPVEAVGWRHFFCLPPAELQLAFRQLTGGPVLAVLSVFKNTNYSRQKAGYWGIYCSAFH